MEDHLNNKDRLNKEWEVIIHIFELYCIICIVHLKNKLPPSRKIIVFWGDEHL